MRDGEVPAGSDVPAFAYPRWVPGADSRAMLREVAPNLYVGGLNAVQEHPTPTQEWWGVVDCHGYTDNTQARGREEAMQTRHRLVRIFFHDGDPVPRELLTAAMGLTRKRRGPLLISCHMGASRSVSVAYAMLRVVDGLSDDEALARVKLPGCAPRPETLQSARRWADEYASRDGRGARVGKVPCHACGGEGVYADTDVPCAWCRPVSEWGKL